MDDKYGFHLEVVGHTLTRCQILSQGRRVPVEEMTAQIDALTAEDLRRVAASIFGVESGKVPTIVSMGASDLGDYHKTFKTYGLSA